MKAELIMNGLVQCRVCSNGTWDETLDWVRKENPAGTEMNWHKHSGDNFKPIQCSDDNTRFHYMFEC